MRINDFSTDTIFYFEPGQVFKDNFLAETVTGRRACNGAAGSVATVGCNKSSPTPPLVSQGSQSTFVNIRLPLFRTFLQLYYTLLIAPRRELKPHERVRIYELALIK